MTRLKHSDLDAMFIEVEVPHQKEKVQEEKEVEVGNCYTLSEVSQKYNANPAVPRNL
ncbi:hypothetical protein OZ666_00655 [Elizabethkingia sp. HX QKY]|uniref:hypothetical protein n=1 Tax=Elizabethkingia TaxID=308865 RepID=UPI002A241C44|nr:hypothetical protein [Elizabethkingia sp. HX QKY]MDX8570169.1 hypothetical protein [Elizabethkingia sp. HX QKY]